MTGIAIQPVSGLTYYWETSAESIGREAWEACFGTEDVWNSFGMARAVERFGFEFEKIEFHYLVGMRGNQAAFLLPCFCVRTSLGHNAPPNVRRCLDLVRRLLPGALRPTIFGAGSPMVGVELSLGHRQLPEQERPRVLAEAKALLLDRARHTGASLVIFKDIGTGSLPLIRRVLEPGFLIVDFLPTTYLPISGPGLPGYAERLRSSHRKKMRKRQRMFLETGLQW